MSAQFTDKLVKSFFSSSNPLQGYNPFTDLQDPTYMSFKLDFFPDLGYSFPDDAYSSGGLFRKRTAGGPGEVANYVFYDSAAEYLARIGAPGRQYQLEAFVSLLWKLQERAPWYFQSVSGVADLFTIDPANNFRGKDKVLTVNCLESLDLRMSLLADLYRNVAFDFQGMREVLPINLRTFNMYVHVLEFRKFNTTFGIISDFYGKNQRAATGQANQANMESAIRKNVYNQGASSLFVGTFDNLNTFATNLNTMTGGVFSNMGEAAGADPMRSLKSAFEAISVQTFLLKDCEFDFYSQAPGYLENLSVKDIAEASHNFKIKVGKIRKIASYSFEDFVISEYMRETKMVTARIIPELGRASVVPSSPYFEQLSLDQSTTNFSEIRKSIFPEDRTTAEAYSAASEDSSKLRKTPLERLLGSVVQNTARSVRNEINTGIGNLTGGVLGTEPLGNIYGNPSFIRSATQALNDFLTPGNQINTGQTSATPPQEVLGNIKFEALSTDKFSPKNVFK